MDEALKQDHRETLASLVRETRLYTWSDGYTPRDCVADYSGAVVMILGDRAERFCELWVKSLERRVK